MTHRLRMARKRLMVARERVSVAEDWVEYARMYGEWPEDMNWAFKNLINKYRARHAIERRKDRIA